MKCISILVKGRVQGVFYRASAKEAAGQLGIRGFVRNEPDGSVYIEAEGDEKAIQQFMAWCRKGPPRAMVTGVEIQDLPSAGFTSFEIDR
jgi:acylphosphatase